jgi:hypothetical protein
MVRQRNEKVHRIPASEDFEDNLAFARKIASQFPEPSFEVWKTEKTIGVKINETEKTFCLSLRDPTGANFAEYSNMRQPKENLRPEVSAMAKRYRDLKGSYGLF